MFNDQFRDGIKGSVFDKAEKGFASAIAMLAQGIPFIQAGQEFLRSKNNDENSYRS